MLLIVLSRPFISLFSILFTCHPERSEGSLFIKRIEILHFVQDDKEGFILSGMFLFEIFNE